MDVFKENPHIFSKFSKNVINDLYKLCFQNYCTSLTKVVMKRKNLNCINHFLEGGGGRGPKTALSPTFSCNAKNKYL